MEHVLSNHAFLLKLAVQKFNLGVTVSSITILQNRHVGNVDNGGERNAGVVNEVHSNKGLSIYSFFFHYYYIYIFLVINFIGACFGLSWLME